jgi:uncharacterized protein YjiK
MLPRLLLGLSLGALAACAGDGTGAPAPPEARTAAAEPVAEAIPYRLDAPDTAFVLPPALREVSGLTAFADGRLGAVQDEDGVLYVLDAATGAVASEHRFHGAGDFEGVEAVGEAVWVLRSNGTLYEIAGGTGAVTEHETALDGDCDAEGLAYEAAGNRLLIACKEDAGSELPGVRAIYAFDLRENRLSERPVALLDRRRLDGDAPFKPSALAVHPRTGQVYVLSSVRKALAVLGSDGRIAAALALPEARYPQPEGLAFLPDGTLFIANEGAAGLPRTRSGGAATLLRFSEVPP